MIIAAIGHRKFLNNKQEKLYKAEIRIDRIPYHSRKNFRRAMQAEIYAVAWAAKVKRMAEAAETKEKVIS